MPFPVAAAARGAGMLASLFRKKAKKGPDRRSGNGDGVFSGGGSPSTINLPSFENFGRGGLIRRAPTARPGSGNVTRLPGSGPGGFNMYAMPRRRRRRGFTSRDISQAKRMIRMLKDIEQVARAPHRKR